MRAALAMLVLVGPVCAQEVRIDGGGSSFVSPLMVKWTAEYAGQGGAAINYQSIGSGAGVQKVATKEFDFGCTDAPLNRVQAAEAYRSGGLFLHVPLVMGAVVPIYNLPSLGDEPLRIDGPTLADIMLGTIKRWNDPRVAALNPQCADKLPDLGIVVVRRADGSGSTFILADYLSKVSPAWREQMGAANNLDWPKASIGAKGTAGVTQKVQQFPGTIGYVELLYAVKNKLPYASVRNPAGEWSRPDHDGVTQAAANALRDRVPPSFRFSITNAPGAGAYPLGGTTWAVVYTKPTPRQQEVVKFLRWATSDRGQVLARDMEFAPLPEVLRTPLDKRLADLLSAPASAGP